MHTIEHQKKKFFIGFELRTNNKECSLAMPAHKDKFFKENIPAKIPHKVSGNILALYTDYEGDETQPYSWILGCEVASLEDVPEGLTPKVIPASNYAVFTTQGAFPEGLTLHGKRSGNLTFLGHTPAILKFILLISIRKKIPKSKSILRSKNFLEAHLSQLFFYSFLLICFNRCASL